MTKFTFATNKKNEKTPRHFLLTRRRSVETPHHNSWDFKSEHRETNQQTFATYTLSVLCSFQCRIERRVPIMPTWFPLADTCCSFCKKHLHNNMQRFAIPNHTQTHGKEMNMNISMLFHKTPRPGNVFYSRKKN